MFSSVYVITSTNRAGVVKQLFINFTMYDYITVLLSFGQNHWWQTDLNKVAFEGGPLPPPPPLKLGKVNDKLRCLGKNNDKNQVYPLIWNLNQCNVNETLQLNLAQLHPI